MTGGFRHSCPMLVDHAASDADLLDPVAWLRPMLAGRRVLLLEDEVIFSAPIIAMLSEAGVRRVDHFTTGEAALSAAISSAYDVLLLDRINPGLDGLSVLRAVRGGHGQSARAPALLVTSLGEPGERVKGLVAGADDYVPKPVLEIELLARIAAQLRRHQDNPKAAATMLISGPLVLDIDTRSAAINGQVLVLTAQSFSVLAELMRVAGQPLSKTMLFERCWPEWTFFPDGWENTIYKAIDRLRDALAPFESAFPAELWPSVVNMRGQGYLARQLI